MQEEREKTKNEGVEAVMSLARGRVWVTQGLGLAVSCWAVSFLVPFFIGGPQLLVGSMVNALLVVAALKLPTRALWPVIIFPSLAVFLRGVIFGPLTIFLAYLIPFIWISNALLVLVTRNLYKRAKWNVWPAAAAGIILKVGWLWAGAWLLIGWGIIPKVMGAAMGWGQVTTAAMGAVVVLGVAGMWRGGWRRALNFLRR